MNRGMYDDDAHEVPGHGATVILCEDDDGDAARVPHEVEAQLRRPWRDETRGQRRDRVVANSVEEYQALDRDGRRACLADYRIVNTDLEAAFQVAIHDIIMAESRDVPPHDAPPPPEEDEAPAMAPVYAALALCVLAQVVVQLLLVALRVGGALDWSWGWTLAPTWVPSTVATVLVVVLGLALAALDERDAARRRRA